MPPPPSSCLGCFRSSSSGSKSSRRSSTKQQPEAEELPPQSAPPSEPTLPAAAAAAVAAGEDEQTSPPVPSSSSIYLDSSLSHLHPAIDQGILRLAVRMGKESISPRQWDLLLSLLPAVEATKVRRYFHEKDRRLALGSLILQRAVTSWVLGASFVDLEIRRTEPYNKPYVETGGTRLPGWNYNVSHHGDWVVIATEPWEAVGTDVVDFMERPFEAMTSWQYLDHFRRHLTGAEWGRLMRLGEEGEEEGGEGAGEGGEGEREEKEKEKEASQYRAFYRIWAMKEAYIKALGFGLSFPIRRLECEVVDLGKDIEAGLEQQRGDEKKRKEEGNMMKMDGYAMHDWKLEFAPLPSSYLWCTAVGPQSTSSSLLLGGGMGGRNGCGRPCGGCLAPAAAAASSMHGPAAAAAITTEAASAASTAGGGTANVLTPLAPPEVQQQLRREFHVLTLRQCLPLLILDEWEKAAAAAE